MTIAKREFRPCYVNREDETWVDVGTGDEGVLLGKWLKAANGGRTVIQWENHTLYYNIAACVRPTVYDEAIYQEMIARCARE